ncbi:FecR family protein [Sphingobacterium detergens]|uniref:FecR family protein n=1 Tax=Sphingobacterium detergens TaxID=1145106 RepID=A0A420BGK4_SPHD1|nr:FecR family protein [Sphingobacterium detergens]RKE55842.1 FecR family protein [Sphingobacterium detergens]
MKKIDRIVNLIRKHLIYGESKKLIDKDSLLKENPELGPILDELNDREDFKQACSEYTRIATDRNGMKQQMLDRIFDQIGNEGFVQRQKRQISWLIAVASIVIFLSIGLWQWSNWYHQNKAATVSEQFADIQPGNNKATLKIVGRNNQVDLSGKTGGIVVGKTLKYTDGEEVLPSAESADADFLMELITPKGGEYKITLSDGTKVHLNAESKLTYPKNFHGSQRSVDLVGEGYFEVAKQRGTTFIVRTAKEEVKVLGTHFNISTYRNEEISSVSLIEGKVQVNSEKETKLLSPGQQTVNNKGKLSVQTINEDEILAWTNGEFMFNNENLESVMEKIARWYDIEVKVSPSAKDISIWGSVSRYGSFEKVLDVIKLTNREIKFKREGRSLYVTK